MAVSVVNRTVGILQATTVFVLLWGCGAAVPSGGDRGGSSAEDPAYGPHEFDKEASVAARSPADELASFVLPPGFTMEPVLTDPAIEEPAQIAFDGNGRMFVLELRGLMQDIHGTGQLAPVGRISRHEDRNNDGVYQTHQVFVDHLVFPRFVMPFGADAILTKEANADEVWKFIDTNGDGTADRKELFATDFGRLANVEHQESGLMWALDNWLYSTVNQVRLRWTPAGVRRERTGANSGQWGATQDDDGIVWFQQGMSGLPVGFQFPIAYGMFASPGQYERDLTTTWGAPVLTKDLQVGLRGTRPDGSVLMATASAGNDVFRGDRLPADLRGDYFHGDAVARVVRRLRSVRTEGRPKSGGSTPTQSSSLPLTRCSGRSMSRRLPTAPCTSRTSTGASSSMRSGWSRTCANAWSSSTWTRSFVADASGGSRTRGRHGAPRRRACLRRARHSLSSTSRTPTGGGAIRPSSFWCFARTGRSFQSW